MQRDVMQKRVGVEGSPLRGDGSQSAEGAFMRAVIITGPGFQDQDVIYTYSRLRGEGYQVQIATEAGKPVRGIYGMPLPFPFDCTARPLIAFEYLKVSAYDLVLCPGGYEAPDCARQDRKVKAFVKGMHEAGKVVAGIDHGIWIMLSAGIMAGRRAGADGVIKEDLERVRARVSPREVVVDGTLVTCSTSLWLEAFMKAVLEQVEHHTTGELIAISPPAQTSSVPTLRQRSFEELGA
jgi:protease I